MPNEEKISVVQLLVVEDDASLSEWMCDYLTTQGYEVTLADNGNEAIELIKSDVPDMVILDVMLPGKDGFDVCKEVRSFYSNPILMLTARTEEIDEILGIELGADDYLAKPVKPRVLLTRIKALLRRSFSSIEPETLKFGSLLINVNSQTVTLMGDCINLSSNEFTALLLLARNAGNKVSRNNLLQQLRGLEYDGENRSVDILISRLRKKLSDEPSLPRRIKTIRGEGYLFATDAW
ncbi:MAG: response regulator transcription factor [Methylococcales bacterium]